jgi:nicotinamidase-related amidase
MPGSPELQLPDHLRDELHNHIETLRRGFEHRGWGRRVGYGSRPALVVIDLALGWTDDEYALGSDLDAVVENTARLLSAAREAGVPIFFTTMAIAPDDPVSPADVKLNPARLTPRSGSRATELDPRLARRSTEKLIVKKYASCFKGTDLIEMLATVGADTLIITGCSTSHCVYATCRDAVSAFHVIVPREAVGERCELLHEVALFDIDMGIGDVEPIENVLNYLSRCAVKVPVATR